MIRKHFMTGFSALAIGVAGLTATPAQASDDTAKIIAGVAALAIIGTAIAKSNKRDHRDHALSRGHSPRYYGQAKHKKYRYKPHGGHKRYKYRNHRRYGRHHYNYGY